MLLTAIRKEKKDLIEKGTAIGIEKGKIETSINMIKEGFDDKIITKITGLNLEKIEELRKNS
ncbi:MAG: hypothetical protein U0457_00285 [Candidatus Sericytochromatia bacterium]